MNGAAQVTRVSVVLEYADGQVTRMSCDQPAHAQVEVNWRPAFAPGWAPWPATVMYSSPPGLRVEVTPGYAPVSVETVQDAAIASARGLQYAVSYSEEYPEALQYARKRARAQLAIATLDAGCVMLALPGEHAIAGQFGERTLEFTVPVAPAA